MNLDLLKFRLIRILVINHLVTIILVKTNSITGASNACNLQGEVTNWKSNNNGIKISLVLSKSKPSVMTSHL